MISNELLKKYNMMTLEEYKEIFGDSKETELTFYKTILIQTDHIPNKITEQLVENLAGCTIINFIEVFLQFIVSIKTTYKDILECRKFAREQINLIESEISN